LGGAIGNSLLTLIKKSLCHDGDSIASGDRDRSSHKDSIAASFS